jgi:hypothetical protein
MGPSLASSGLEDPNFEPTKSASFTNRFERVEDVNALKHEVGVISTRRESHYLLAPDKEFSKLAFNRTRKFHALKEHTEIKQKTLSRIRSMKSAECFLSAFNLHFKNSSAKHMTLLT